MEFLHLSPFLSLSPPLSLSLPFCAVGTHTYVDTAHKYLN